MRYKEGFYKLKEVSNITMGQSPKSEFYNEEKIGTPFLQGNTTFGAKYPGIEKYTTKETRISNRNEVLMSVRAPVGDININPYERICIGRGLCSISLKNNKNQYLYYFLKANEAIIRSKGTGTVFASINKSDVENIKIFLPDEDEISSYVAPLKALDDKIENNNAIIANLEAQAQAIFKSWFIDFEPFQDGEFVDSELGKIPKGWKVVQANDWFVINIGKTPPRKETEWFSYNKEDIKWLSISDMANLKVFIGETSEYLTEEAIKKFNVKIAPENSVLLSFKLTVGRVGITREEITTNEAIAHFHINDVSELNYLYLYLRQFNYEKLGNTSSIGNAVNSKVIKAMPILKPDWIKLEKFHEIVNPHFDTIYNLVKQNQKLAETRDTLLPKLMSGEIRVGDVDLEEMDNNV